MSNDADLYIRLYLDEDVHGDLGKALRQQGYDVLSVNEAKQHGLSDLQQLEFAIEQNRTIFTFNTVDFIELHLSYLSQTRSHSGIIVSKQIPIKETIRRLLILLDRMSAEEIQNQLYWLPIS
jgi:predicted nuclease of predicted toxin-antitoxin system